MACNLRAMGSNLEVMASNLVRESRVHKSLTQSDISNLFRFLLTRSLDVFAGHFTATVYFGLHA